MIQAKYPISDDDMKVLLTKYPFLKHRKIYDDKGDVYETEQENLDNNWYKIWDGTGWENLWKNKYLPRLFEKYDTWSKDVQEQFGFADVKSKYGQMRIYTSSGSTDDLELIAEWISEYTCEACGEEPRDSEGRRVIWRASGWIMNMCRKCAGKYLVGNRENWSSNEIDKELDGMKTTVTTRFGYLRTKNGKDVTTYFKETADGWLEKEV